MSERVRSVLGSLVEDLKPRESISSIGLFGSWSRGDAVQSSDVDLLIVDRRDFDHEYIERIEFDDLLLDLNYIPGKWMIGRIPPEIDQKIYEVEVLYDRDQNLTKMKKWILKTYWTDERVDLRTESYIMDAYTYLSRATSAQNREDLRSASIYAIIGLEEILKILIEVNMLPISNSRFVNALETSARELDMQETFDNYVEISKLSDLDPRRVENGLNSFESAWNEAMSSIESLDSTLKTLHVKVRRNLNYYAKSIFLTGFIARSKALIEEKAFVEAGHYINRTLVEMLENFAWLALAAKGFRFDHATLFSSLGSFDFCKTIHDNAVKTFRLEDISLREFEVSLKKTREIINHIRQRRKQLIRKHVKPPNP